MYTLDISSKTNHCIYLNGTEPHASLIWSSQRNDRQRFWPVFPLLSCPVLPCPALPWPGLPSPPLCCAPQSGSSGMWWPRTGQSPAFMAPRPTLEVCDWEPWSQSGGWPESIHPSPVLPDTRCPPLHRHVTARRHISHTPLSAALHFICCTTLIHVVDRVDPFHR